jgi:SAM-dependent methyltransferase
MFSSAVDQDFNNLSPADLLFFEKFMETSPNTEKGFLRLYSLRKTISISKLSFKRFLRCFFKYPSIYLRFFLEDLDFGPVDRFLRKLRKKRVLEYLKNHEELCTILDVGCGRQASLGWDFLFTDRIYYGLDRDIPTISFRNLNLIQGSAESAQFQTEFGCIIALAVLEHLDSPKEFIQRTHSLLGPRGKVILTTPHPKAAVILDFLSFLHLINADEIEEHKHYFDMTSLEDLLEICGFSVVFKKRFLFGLNSFIVGEKD